MPSSPICLTADEANITTSPCVTSATVGMFFETFGPLSTVFCTSDTSRSRPSPQIFVSNLPLNFPNSSIPAKLARFSDVSAFAGSKPSQSLCCSHQVTASKVRDRKTLPLLQQTTVFPSCVSSFDFSVATVVPFPVPERPQRITSPPPLPPFDLSLTVPRISSATWSGVLPRTSIDMYCSGTKFGSRTPLSLARSIPRWSFSPSSQSRRRVLSPSDFERD
mmetsp:Transcript_2079/g.4967  ORF Transcript_2079/g.4967 Transcript_2079/m.4967 type:complete len:220 (-) Transcript_2079:383-1042(-)